MTKLRIWADFNSGGCNDDACWCLAYGPELTSLDDLALSLRLEQGQEVTLYYNDPGDEFEVEGRLERHASTPSWHARPDWSTFRLIRD
ncbi:hypothetical protein [Sphingomonas profundi]|uniref:hypothetical protein n=1 Tax=Alterirhizorhabdus profundi TaxID=2681549 RepID=UPI0012E84131|nr:hypothetical protein [Sphingomonas profundi]